VLWLLRILSVLALVLALLWLVRGGLRRRSGDPSDYEAELIRLCRGHRDEAERLIQEEMQRSPELSRVGAAMAAVTRIRHERGGYPSPL
jgi:hypothetical protein